MYNLYITDLIFDFPECENLEPAQQSSIKSPVKLKTPFSFQNPEVVSLEFMLTFFNIEFKKEAVIITVFCQFYSIILFFRKL